MTLQEAKLLHAYNSWATNRIFDALASVPEETYRRDMKAGHESIHGTLVHMVDVEKVWLSRWNRTPDPPHLSATAIASLEQLRSVWNTVGFETAKFLGTMSDRKLQESLVAPSPRGERYTHTFSQTLQHVVDHSSYHRGQVLLLMRQAGLQPPVAGLIVFYRETGKLVSER